MIKAILFDIDDTLTNREYAAYRLYRVLFQPYFQDPLLLEAVIQDMMVAEQYSNCSKQAAQDQIEARYHVRFDFLLTEIWDRKIGSYGFAFEDTADTLDYLKEKYRLGVVTNGYIDTQNEKLVRAGILDRFEMVLTSQEAGVVKPDPKIFALAAEKMGLKANECVYVGDTFSNDIYGAIKAGMEAVWIWKRGDRLCEYDVRRIGKLSDLKDLY